MPNHQHIEILDRGVRAWNAWRATDPEIPPDLSGAQLAGRDLTGINLAEADLSAGDLRRGNLTGADLGSANLREANLSRATLVNSNLELADLIRTNLTKSDLRGATLRLADLSGAILRETELIGVDLTGAGFASTTFGATLLTAEGLEGVRHYGPSFLDPATVERSWPLPRSFLRSCGWPEGLIAGWTSIAGHVSDYWSCFISHSSVDEPFADRLYVDLQDAGVRCWFAPHDMRIGAKIRDALDANIRRQDRVLLILSRGAIASEWVADEVEAAFERERAEGEILLVPIRLDNAVLDAEAAWAAKLRRQRHVGDFTDWRDPDAYDRALSRLLHALRRDVARSS